MTRVTEEDLTPSTSANLECVALSSSTRTLVVPLFSRYLGDIPRKHKATLLSAVIGTTYATNTGRTLAHHMVGNFSRRVTNYLMVPNIVLSQLVGCLLANPHIVTDLTGTTEYLGRDLSSTIKTDLSNNRLSLKFEVEGAGEPHLNDLVEDVRQRMCMVSQAQHLAGTNSYAMEIPFRNEGAQPILSRVRDIAHDIHLIYTEIPLWNMSLDEFPTFRT